MEILANRMIVDYCKNYLELNLKFCAVMSFIIVCHRPGNDKTYTIKILSHFLAYSLER